MRDKTFSQHQLIKLNGLVLCLSCCLEFFSQLVEEVVSFKLKGVLRGIWTEVWIFDLWLTSLKSVQHFSELLEILEHRTDMTDSLSLFKWLFSRTQKNVGISLESLLRPLSKPWSLQLKQLYMNCYVGYMKILNSTLQISENTNILADFNVYLKTLCKWCFNLHLCLVVYVLKWLFCLLLPR